MPKLTYLHLRQDGRISLALEKDEWVVYPSDHAGNVTNIYATLLGAYLTQTPVNVIPVGNTKRVRDVAFGEDPS